MWSMPRFLSAETTSESQSPALGKVFDEVVVEMKQN